MLSLSLIFSFATATAIPFHARISARAVAASLARYRTRCFDLLALPALILLASGAPISEAPKLSLRERSLCIRAFPRLIHNRSKRTKSLDKPLGSRFCILTRNCKGEEQFKELIICEGFPSCLTEALPQSAAMAYSMIFHGWHIGIYRSKTSTIRNPSKREILLI